MRKVIYDIGSNNGDDIPYYLHKADLVVAVEANPVLCEQIRQRFKSEMATDRLVVENVVISSQDDREVDFYIHQEFDILSTMDAPIHDITSYKKVLLPAKNIISLFNQYGNPFYVKVDIEGADETIVRAMFQVGIYPPYLSVEAHDVGVLGVLMALGNYRHFKMVAGATVHNRYANTIIVDRFSKLHHHSFPVHSAGPFGDDIHGDWMLTNVFMRYFMFAGPGWKDIHVTNLPVNQVADNHTELGDIHGASTKWLLWVTINRILNRLSRLLFGKFQK
jgi:FkbM family methyltransferase